MVNLRTYGCGGGGAGQGAQSDRKTQQTRRKCLRVDAEWQRGGWFACMHPRNTHPSGCLSLRPSSPAVQPASATLHPGTTAHQHRLRELELWPEGKDFLLTKTIASAQGTSRHRQASHEVQ